MHHPFLSNLAHAAFGTAAGTGLCLLGGTVATAAVASGTWLVAQAAGDGGLSPGTGAGTGFVIGSIISSLGVSWFIPYLRERNTQSKLDAVIAEAVENRKRIAELEGVAKAERERREEAQADKDRAERTFLEKLTMVLDRHNRLAAHLLEVQGRIAPGTADGLPLIIDDAPAAPGPRVLVVEDNPAARDGMVSLLISQHCRVDAVETGGEAVAKLDSGDAYDVVVCDLMLPGGVSGEDVLRHIRDRKLAVRVVVVTAMDEDRLGSVRALLVPAGDRLFRKPVDFGKDLLPFVMGRK